MSEAILNNLVQYLRDRALGITIVADVLTEESPINCVVISQSGGSPDHFYPRTDWRFQVLSRARASTDAKAACEKVYVVLKNKWDLVFPAVTVDGVVYPTVTGNQVSPIQTPAGIGADQANLFMWVFNLMVVTT